MYACGKIIENGFIGITRLILLDSMLLGFSALTFTSYVWFRNQSHVPFSAKWKTALITTGVGIGCVSSTKWVGFFITALIGLLTIEELWGMLNDRSMPKGKFIRHFANRAFGLIVVPVTIYVLSFKAHFMILNRSGTGDANMSSLFQAGLEGNDLSSSPIQVSYGSFITLKSHTINGGLLHSHVQVYPEGSSQQQVTTYHHKDANNLWRIVYPGSEGSQQIDPIDYDAIDPLPVQNGDIVRLMHNMTGRMLHSHRIAAPINKKDYEVSAYGALLHWDPNDLWQVEIVRDRSSGPALLRSLSTSFRLKHVATGCYLKSRNNPLPSWGFNQGEVSCDYTPELGSKYLEWNVEEHKNAKCTMLRVELHIFHLISHSFYR
jgi:dolichyl-phosphate-mannose-protein mannosyltransferase